MLEVSLDWGVRTRGDEDPMAGGAQIGATQAGSEPRGALQGRGRGC